MKTEETAGPAGKATGGARGEESLRRTRRVDVSTSNPNSLRKSAPRIGRSTAARRKENSNRRPPNCRGSTRDPQAGHGRPSAISRRGPEGGAADLCGKTEREAPVSTRKSRLVRESRRYVREPPAGRPFSSGCKT